MLLKTKHFEIKLQLLNTDTAKKISQIKYHKTKISTWGEEIYFKSGIKGIKLEKDAKDVVVFGELAYWVSGESIALGFGKTPASINNEIRLVEKTNIWAKFTPSLDLKNKLYLCNDNLYIELINT